MLVSRFDPLKDVPFKGNVVSWSSDQIDIAFEEGFDVNDGLWR